MNWELRPFTSEHEEKQRRLIKELNLHPIVAQILAQRGVTDDCQKFLYGTLNDLPDPFLLDEMDRAVDRLIQAYEKKERVLFFGDYDVDGITGCAQMQSYARETGLRSEVFLPRRMQEGYGLTTESARKILAIRPDLLVTIDNGTSAREPISHFKESGIDVIVVDHHETPSEGERPPTIALLNPKSARSRLEDKNIASAGLVFLLLMALRAKCRERGISSLPNLKHYLDLACLGTIADVVPLIGVNRTLVKYGLEEIAATRRPGLKALMEVASVRPPVNCGSVGFRLAPRINAAGRLSDPRWALDLLLTEDMNEAATLAGRLNDFNRERQVLEEKAVREAIEKVEKEQGDRMGIVVASADWHLGVVGIVAAKLTERFGRPALVLSISEDGLVAKGSARSVPGFSVYKALKKIEREMTRFGGHDAAAGMTVPANHLGEFARKFDQSVREEWRECHAPRLMVDAVVPLKDINSFLIRELGLLAPHGPFNPEPVFMASDVSLTTSRIVGTSHLKTILCQSGTRLDAIGFGWGPYLETAIKNNLHQVAFFPEFNDWKGRESVQIKIKSILPILRL